MAKFQDVPYSTGITPETVAAYVEAIANDKAVRLMTMAKATVVMCVKPLWVRAEEARALYGLPPNKLLEWAASGRIVAKKTDPKKRGSATVYKVASLEKALEGLMDYGTWLKSRKRNGGAK